MRYLAILLLCLGGLTASAEERKLDTKLLEACSAGEVRDAKLLIEQGASPQARRPSGRTALHLAAASGDVSTIRLLLQHGADVRALDGLGRSTLDEAVASNNSEALCLLLEAGCQPTARTRALRSWQMREARVEKLLADDADPQASLFAAAQQGDYDLVRTLLDRGADLHLRDTYGKTALHIAAEHSRATIIELLISRGADPNALNKEREAPLHVVNQYRPQAQLATVQALVLGGARLDLPDRYHQTPMRGLSLLHRWEIYDWLLDYCEGQEPTLARDPSNPLLNESTEELLTLLERRQPDTYAHAGSELLARGRAIMPAVLKRMQQPKEYETYRGLLLFLGPAAEAALPQITEQLGDARRVEDALGILQQIRRNALRDLPFLEKQRAAETLYQAILRRQIEPQGDMLATYLVRLGPAAAPAIVRLLTHRETRLRLAMTGAMHEAKFHDASIVNALRRLMNDPHVPQARLPVAQAMLFLDATREEAKWELIAILNSPPAVAKKAPHNYDYESAAFKQWREDADKAARTLVRLGPDILDDLLPSLSGSDQVLGRDAVTILHRLGPPAVPRLIELLSYENPYIAQAASAALGQMGRDAVPELLLTMQSPHDKVAVRAIATLHGTRSREQATLDALFAIVNDKSRADDVRLEAAYAVFDPDRQRNTIAASGDTFAIAKRLLKTGNFRQQYHAARLIQSFGPAAADALPLLKQALATPDGPVDGSGYQPYSVRIAAGDAIRRLEQLDKGN